MQESDLYLAWQKLARNAEVVLYEGKQLSVLQAGRLNKTRGPDFLSSRFCLDGVVYQGDVECHLRQREWYSHGHHLDNAFSNVILHIVGTRTPGKQKTVNHKMSGRSIPDFYLPVKTNAPAFCSCSARNIPRNILEDQALERFKIKEHVFTKMLAEKSFEQVFYEAFFRALGYPQNADNFNSLAERLNYAWLQDLSARIWIDEHILLALYLGQAGLLPFEAADEYSKTLSMHFSRYRKFLPGALQDGGQWRFAAVRPLNHPHFRLAAWCRLFHLQNEWPGRLLSELFRQRQSFSKLFKLLHNYFSGTCTSYWQTHYALDKSLGPSGAGFFWGRARIIEIIINVLLPLLAAQAAQEKSSGFHMYLEEFYLWLPLKSLYSAQLKQFPWLAEAGKVWPAQALYQAALHLEQSYCRCVECNNCPLSQYF